MSQRKCHPTTRSKWADHGWSPLKSQGWKLWKKQIYPRSPLRPKHLKGPLFSQDLQRQSRLREQGQGWTPWSKWWSITWLFPGCWWACHIWQAHPPRFRRWKLQTLTGFEWLLPVVQWVLPPWLTPISIGRANKITSNVLRFSVECQRHGGQLICSMERWQGTLMIGATCAAIWPTVRFSSKAVTKKGAPIWNTKSGCMNILKFQIRIVIVLVSLLHIFWFEWMAALLGRSNLSANKDCTLPEAQQL